MRFPIYQFSVSLMIALHQTTRGFEQNLTCDYRIPHAYTAIFAQYRCHLLLAKNTLKKQSLNSREKFSALQAFIYKACRVPKKVVWILSAKLLKKSARV